MLGGFLMVAVGVVYLVFEEKILADFSSTTTSRALRKENHMSRALIGIQVSSREKPEAKYFLIVS
jgi:phosphatidylinositol glycan class N